MSNPTSAFTNHSAPQNQAGTQHVYDGIHNTSVYNTILPPGQEPWSKGNVHWTVSRPVNTLFTGRKRVLEDIERIIYNSLAEKQPAEPCRIVISGMGGQGKSEICLRLAHSMREHFWGVFWVDVSNVGTAKTGFMNISKQLNKPVETIEEAQYMLSSVPHPWLLVLDNADDVYHDYQQYLPAGQQGFVLMTSRNEDCGRHATAKHERLEELDDADAELLLFKTAKIPETEYPAQQTHAHAVYTLLGSHALALIQAGSYVAQRHCTLAEYPQVYGRYRQRLLQYHPRQAQSRYRNVHATFEISAQVLESSTFEDAKDALELLTVLSMLEKTTLPLSIFKGAWLGGQYVRDRTVEDNYDRCELVSWHADQLPKLIKANWPDWDSFRLKEAIHLLQSLGLVFGSDKDGLDHVSMHPLTHTWARERQSLEQKQQSWITTACTFLLSQQDTTLWLHQQRKLQSHLLALLEWTIADSFSRRSQSMIARIYLNLASALHKLGMNDNLWVLLKDLSVFLELDLTQACEGWLEFYRLLASNLRRNGRFHESIKVIESELVILQNRVSPEDQRRLRAQQDLAYTYSHIHEHEKAVSLYESVAEIQARTLPAEHSDILKTQHGLANSYRGLGDYKKSITLLEELIEINKRILAPEDPKLLSSQHMLARAYSRNGQMEMAKVTYQGVIETQQRLLGFDHPERLICLIDFAFTQLTCGDVEESIATAREVVDVQRRTLPAENPWRFYSQYVLGAGLFSNGQFMEAIAMVKEVLDVQHKKLWSNDSFISTQGTLAVTNSENKQTLRTTDTSKKALVSRGEVSNSVYPDSLSVLGRAYFALEQYEEAAPVFEVLVEIARQLGWSNSLPSKEHWLALTSFHNGRTAEAISLMESVVRGLEANAETDSDVLLTAYHNQALFLKADKQYTRSLELVRHVVQTKQMSSVKPEDRESDGLSEDLLAQLEKLLADTKESSSSSSSELLSSSDISEDNNNVARSLTPKISSTTIGMNHWYQNGQLPQGALKFLQIDRGGEGGDDNEAEID